MIKIIEKKKRKYKKKNQTPLHYAAENNSKEIGEILISKGADLNIKTNENKGFFLIKGGRTPIHYAAEKNSKDIFKVLISKGADINAKDIIDLNIILLFLIILIQNLIWDFNKKQLTALHIAADKNSKEIAEILLLKGADINAKDKSY